MRKKMTSTLYSGPYMSGVKSRMAIEEKRSRWRIGAVILGGLCLTVLGGIYVSL